MTSIYDELPVNLPMKALKKKKTFTGVAISCGGESTRGPGSNNLDSRLSLLFLESRLGFESRTRRHMWVESVCCWFSSLLRGFVAGYSSFPPSTKANISTLIPIRSGNSGRELEPALCGFPLKFSFIFIIFYLSIPAINLTNKINTHLVFNSCPLSLNQPLSLPCSNADLTKRSKEDILFHCRLLDDFLFYFGQPYEQRNTGGNTQQHPQFKHPVR